MSKSYDSVKARPLHKIIEVVKGLLVLQMEGGDVAIPALVGDAGIGKTALLHKMCQESGFNLLDIHYGLKPLEEISGLPDFAESININMASGVQTIKNTRWTLPDILGEAHALAHNGRPTVIFLDDFHASSPGNMALGYEMFTEKKLRGYPFPPKTAFVLAMNQQGSKDLGNPIPAPIVNRIAMFKVVSDFEVWKSNFAIPNRINSKIVSFLSNSKNLKHFQQEEQVNKPWASARAWTKLSGLLNPLETHKMVDYSDIMYYASAHVGDEAASEFATYYKIFSQVDVEKIFDRHIEPKAPDEMAQQYIYILANVSEFFNRFCKEGITDLQKKDIFETMAKIIMVIAEKAVEISIVGLKELIMTENSLKLKGNIYSGIRQIIATQKPLLLEKISNDIKSI